MAGAAAPGNPSGPMSDAVLLMAYGSPETLADVERYYTHIRGGRRPSPELLAELIGRYRAIGGRSPLGEITRRQAAALEGRLRERGLQASVRVGMKHSPPFIADVVAQLGDERIRRAVGLVLAPHYSRLSVGAYIEAAERARPATLQMTYVESWHDHPGFLVSTAARLGETMNRFTEDPFVLFTAHALPERILSWQDPYPDQVRGSAQAAAGLAGVARWDVAFQSAGRTAEPWLGPDLGTVLSRLRDQGERAVVICPIGFVADHLEVLYDIDVEAQAQARALGLRLARTAMPNDAPDFIAALADLVAGRLAEQVR